MAQVNFLLKRKQPATVFAEYLLPNLQAVCKKVAMSNQPDVILLFSGGLDSLLAAKLLEEQHLRVKCLHLISPFFGSAAKSGFWKDAYGLDVECLDVSPQFSAMLASPPVYGYGKNLNPCVDCKILQLQTAKQVMEQCGARFLATGEVPGQRPMSQRQDAMRIITSAAGVEDILERPLCAAFFPPTLAQKSGIVDASRFPAISGRGRKEQFALAERFGIKNIPTPSGGCLLTEKESSRRYWQILKRYKCSAVAMPEDEACDGGCANRELPQEFASDLRLVSLGRQFWREFRHDGYWLCIGRDQQGNEELMRHARARDAILKLNSIPGPLGLARNGAMWPLEILEEAAALLAAHCGKARKLEQKLPVRVERVKSASIVEVYPDRQVELWGLPSWETARAEIRRAMESGRKRAAS